MEEDIKGTDGEIGGVRVCTTSACGRSMVMIRPLWKLFPMKVRAVTGESAPELEGNDNVA